jgi:hypothetical protein
LRPSYTYPITIMTTRPVQPTIALFFSIAFFCLPLSAQSEPAKETPPATPAEAAKATDADAQKKLADAIRAVKMPGIEINTTERFVDVSASVCLDEGALELIACTKDTKEHESIVVINARPSHIHAALLLLGAKNGNPAMRQPLDKEMTRWQDIPAKGDPIQVSLAWKKEDGTITERSLSDFLMRSEFGDNPPKEGEKKEKFPDTFLFAGSHLGDPSESPRKYLAELSGHVISISTFGDELLCLPEFYGQENHALAWQIDPTHLPKRHTEVLLRLRVKKPQP